MLSSQFAVSSFYLTSFQRSVMSRPIFHELQIEVVQHGADRDAEKHSKNAEHLAVLLPAHNVPSGGRADIDCKEVFHSFNSHSILGKNVATGYPSCPPLPSDKVRHGDGLEESSAMQTPIFQNGRLRFQSFCR